MSQSFNPDYAFANDEDEEIVNQPLQQIAPPHGNMENIDQQDPEYEEDYDDEEDWEEEDWDDEEWDEYEREYGSEGNVSLTVAAQKQVQQSQMSQFDRLANIEIELGGNVKEKIRKDDARRIRVKEKASRATTELVMDPRTRMILYKMLNNGTFTEINGCISTGKEANVYHAHSNEGERAIKIYKTSILVFKDRERYVNGEFRFRRGYSKHNPRKMVRVWAEKEMRNLLRLQHAGIPCPTPLKLTMHVLVMDFIGKEGWPAPRLKDVELDLEQFGKCYLQCVKMMRRIYHRCRLVHADFSEYNILYFKGRCYVIDVSQSVEHDHPNALKFLRQDCLAITTFFAKKGVLTMTLRELFDFITDITISENDIDSYLDTMQETITQRPIKSVAELIDDKVFLESFIPRTLNDVSKPSRDIAKIIDQENEDEIKREDAESINELLQTTSSSSASSDSKNSEILYGKITGLGDIINKKSEKDDEVEDNKGKLKKKEKEKVKAYSSSGKKGVDKEKGKQQATKKANQKKDTKPSINSTIDSTSNNKPVEPTTQSPPSTSTSTSPTPTTTSSTDNTAQLLSMLNITDNNKPTTTSETKTTAEVSTSTSTTTTTNSTDNKGSVANLLSLLSNNTSSADASQPPIINVVVSTSLKKKEKDENDDSDSESDDGSGSDSDSSEDSEDGESKDSSGNSLVRKRGETTEERKARKDAAKSDKRDKRRAKVPKHVKRRKEALSKRNNKKNKKA
eukprot:TRINITY_DN2578_c0_g1_i1.p1 TRINITY_DN2578_c0_g1~~TRINITY_DN2578_c0_g1_i1.p1  ORF type:complete len:754 (+),score=275.98 TRINITY_DN2578_c0_g1_i1:50-2263(+)